MEIIKRGKKPDSKEYFGTCHRCQTEVKFQRHEGTVHYDPRDGDFIQVKCPVCEHPITALL